MKDYIGREERRGGGKCKVGEVRKEEKRKGEKVKRGKERRWRM